MSWSFAALTANERIVADHLLNEVRVATCEPDPLNPGYYKLKTVHPNDDIFRAGRRVIIQTPESLRTWDDEREFWVIHAIALARVGQRIPAVGARCRGFAELREMTALLERLSAELQAAEHTNQNGHTTQAQSHKDEDGLDNDPPDPSDEPLEEPTPYDIPSTPVTDPPYEQDVLPNFPAPDPKANPQAILATRYDDFNMNAALAPGSRFFHRVKRGMKYVAAMVDALAPYKYYQGLAISIYLAHPDETHEELTERLREQIARDKAEADVERLRRRMRPQEGSQR